MKTMKKLLTLVLALVLAMSVVPGALAANHPDSVEAYLSKTYNAEKGHAFDFVFSAEQDTSSLNCNHTPVALTIGTDNKISFTEGETGTTTKVAKLNFADFTQAGVYRYIVKETSVNLSFVATEHEKLIMSKAEYEVLVYVQQVKNGGLDIGINDNWEGNHQMGIDSLSTYAASNDPADYKIVSIIVSRLKDDAGVEIPGGEKVDDITPTPNTNDFNFENTYVYEAGVGPDPEHPDPQYTQKGSLRISKKVVNQSAAAADSTDKTPFDFTVTFTFPAGTNEKTLGGVTANNNPITLTGGTTYTFKLKTDEAMRFNKLPVGTKFTVVETGTPNYIGTAQTTIDAQVTEEKATVYGGDLTVTEKKLSVNSNTVDVTNTNLYIPPMGVMINVLPYVMMFAIGGGALMLFIFLKRRKNETEEG